MTKYKSVPEGKDPLLWEMAHKRAEFKRHFMMYIVINIFLWILWFMSNDSRHQGIPWPVYPGVGWGIGIMFHYLGTYRWPEENSVEKEYEKLVNNKK